ncbi:CRISPR-associated helicase Cas3' [Mariprofundus erugo]|uniref:CRISPR-associated helicase Cas3 n=1 Tax=Mariprofundus erugo TaxID=2528639 RepID=A0A5R9GUA1_9PROT|nr:CRISPR-associated helicase Cas3' [Mariprofundus erugo]TLS67622.1 CRISPR-associated helicase Cas3' [Mariprofundus erugo]
MASTKYAAHINEAKEIHHLEEHLLKVAHKAAGYAEAFHSELWAELAGRWHDLGKYSATFQKMIYEANGMDAHVEPETSGPRNHSSAGALYAVEKLGVAGRVLAYLIAGHHAGLPDWFKVDAPGQALGERLQEKEHLEDARKADIPYEILAGATPTQAPVGGSDGFALWVRMLFSSLVDADFLDTESFYDPDKAGQRGNYPYLCDLKCKFDNHMRVISAEADDTEVNRIRAGILADCRRAGLKGSGIFSLTVPTGGGKTLSSMAFALEHAVRHGKSRIIYVIPYTSIIEQTANIFRGIFGDSVIEHHSSLDPDKENHRSRLASENWDAPIVVTTNVQFFESLFAARTSRCRKLHNIANSIVILDEAQLMPPEFLKPILKVMNLLSEHYGVTFVISTATQPALGSMKDPFGRVSLDGLDDVKEIISDPDELYSQLERVSVKMPDDFQQQNSWEDMASEIGAYESVLAIVNTRQDARELYRLMPECTIHLSALMCGEHRSQVIAEIKQRLKSGLPTRVVSTQLVEAGVDLDFPVVYRAMAGLDSIAQAAGRCNREGKLQEKGKVVVFVPPKPAPVGHLRRAETTTVSLMSGYKGDPLARGNFKRFFEHFYDKCELDKEGIESLLCPEADLAGVQFRTAAMKMQLIKDAGVQVLVPANEESEALLDQLKVTGPYRELMRKLQRYSVNVSQFWFDKMKARGDVIEIHSGIFALVSPALYHREFGLLLEGEPMAAEQTIW